VSAEATTGSSDIPAGACGCFSWHVIGYCCSLHCWTSLHAATGSASTSLHPCIGWSLYAQEDQLLTCRVYKVVFVRFKTIALGNSNYSNLYSTLGCVLVLPCSNLVLLDNMISLSLLVLWLS
jgi:hypothetical protein